MKLAICVLSAVVLLSGRGESCFQGAAPQLLLRSRNIAGVVTVNGKPWVGAHVWLRESAEHMPQGLYLGGSWGQQLQTTMESFHLLTSDPAGRDTDRGGVNGRAVDCPGRGSR